MNLKRQRVIKWLPYFWASLAYLGFFVIYTWPLAAEFGTAILGISNGTGDAPTVLQNVFHVRRVLAGEDAAFHTHYIFYPEGNSIWMHGHTWLPALIANIFRSAYAGVNVVMVLSFLLSGMGTMWLARRLGLGWWAAFAAGFIYAFSPYKMYQAQDHLWYVLTATVPFYVYQIMAIFREGLAEFSLNRKAGLRLLYAAMLGFITAFTDYYVTFILLIFSALYAIAAWSGCGKVNLFGTRWFWIGFVILTLSGGLITSLLDQWGVDNRQANFWAGDMLGYLLPLQNENVHHAAEGLFGKSISLHGEPYFFLGFAFFALIGFSFWQKSRAVEASPYRPEFRLIALVTFAFFLLTLPLFTLGGHLLIPGPLAWFHYIPFLNNIRVASRFSLLFSLLFPLLILAIPLRRQAIGRIPVHGLLVLILFFEFRPRSYDMLREKDVPPVMHKLADLPGKVLLQVPSGIRDGLREKGRLNTSDLWYQGIHCKRVTAGYHSRLPDEFFERAESDAFFSAFYRLQTDSTAVVEPMDSLTAAEFMRRVKPDWLLIAPGWQSHAASRWLAEGLRDYWGDTMVNSAYLLISLRPEYRN